MPVTDSSLRDEYAAAVERVAGRALDALTGGGRAVALTDPTSTAELAALRVLGPDLFAAQLLTGAPLESVTTASLAAALLAFPPDPAEPVGQDALVVAWLDHVSGFLAYRAAPQPAQPPTRSTGSAGRYGWPNSPRWPCPDSTDRSTAPSATGHWRSPGAPPGRCSAGTTGRRCG
ncbi:hypothetical protein ACFQ0T_07840 [Kitasatospora gansuensis]